MYITWLLWKMLCERTYLSAKWLKTALERNELTCFWYLEVTYIYIFKYMCHNLKKYILLKIFFEISYAKFPYKQYKLIELLILFMRAKIFMFLLWFYTLIKSLFVISLEKKKNYVLSFFVSERRKMIHCSLVPIQIRKGLW